MSETDTDAQLEEGQPDEVATDAETVDVAATVDVVAAVTEDPTQVSLGELDGTLADAMWDTPDPVASHRSRPSHTLDPVLDVPVSLVVELGRTRMTIGETLRIGRGSIVSLDKDAGEPADLLVNGQLIARGEVVAIDEEFGLRVTEVVSPERRLEAGRG